MDLDTNLRGRLRNTKLAQHDGLFPVFEAVVNSIHSLEEKENFSTTGKIFLTIKRSNQTDLTTDIPHPPTHFQNIISHTSHPTT